jgi:hemerythrin-like domain-containing protein
MPGYRNNHRSLSGRNAVNSQRPIMLPVGLLMIEHRLIERVIKLWENALPDLSKCENINAPFFDPTVDFMSNYADRCHHGKEEDILFRDLKLKEISPQLNKVLNELINEHDIARNAMKSLIAARDRCLRKDPSAPGDFYRSVKKITGLYPAHIEKEDKHFFLPSMEYFSQEQQNRILDEFRDFDRKQIHKKYKFLVADLEKNANLQK